MHRLREHRLTDEQGRFELLDPLYNPMMVSFRAVKERNERPRIKDGGGHRGRSRLNAWNSNQGPELRNQRPRGRASSVPPDSGADAFYVELRVRAAAPPRQDPSACGRAAPPPLWPDGIDRPVTQSWFSSQSHRTIKEYLGDIKSQGVAWSPLGRLITGNFTGRETRRTGGPGSASMR